MKFLVLLLVLLLAGWWAFGRRRSSAEVKPPPKPRPAKNEPQAMLACAHCAVHLPQADAFFDAQGRPFCSEAHRLAGPR